MKTLDQIVDAARAKVTFTDSADYEHFVAKQCDRCLVDPVTCPYVDAAFLGFQPTEWVLGTNVKYRCTARQPIPRA